MNVEIDNQNRKRSLRISGEQMEAILSFIETNKVMLSGKLHPQDIKEIDKLWQTLTAQLNSLRGARKTIEEWKILFIEWKSKTRKTAREIRIDQTGRGKGKVLTELEERLMSLIGWIFVLGNDELPAEIDPNPENGMQEGRDGYPSLQEGMESETIKNNENINYSNMCSDKYVVPKASQGCAFLKERSTKKGKAVHSGGSQQQQMKETLEFYAESSKNTADAITQLSQSIT